MTPPRRHRALAVGGLFVALLTGCSGPRAGSSVSSAISGCATVLPLARAEVPAGSTLVSVHALSRGDAARYLREVGAPLPTPGAPVDPGAPSDPQAPTDPLPGSRRSAPPAAATQPPLTQPPATSPPSPGSSSAAPRAPRGCVVAYRGPFPGGLPHAAPGTTGTYALVFADVRHARVRAVVLVARLPSGLRS